MEGQVYQCAWKKTRGKFVLWLTSDSKVKAESESLAEAQEFLCATICERLGDGEAVLDFSPPLPKSALESRFANPAIVSLSGNTSSNVLGSFDELFTGGYCAKCQSGRGTRSVKPLQIETVESGYDATLVDKTRLLVFSDQFLELLSKKELDTFERRVVKLAGRSRKKFFECIPKTTVPLVPVKGLSFATWVCDACGHQCDWAYFQLHCSINWFVSARTIPLEVVCFAASSYLCMKESRWVQLRGKPGTKGIARNNVGVVRESDVDTNAPVYHREVYDKLQKEKQKVWEAQRDRLLASREVDQLRSFPEIFAYISAQTERQCSFRELNKQFNYPEWRQTGETR